MLGAGIANGTPGDLDSTFGTEGLVIAKMGSVAGSGNELIWDIAVQPDGKTVAVGSTSDAITQSVVARFRHDGSLDPTFVSGGKLIGNIWGEARAVTIQPDGKCLVAGFTDNSYDGKRFAVVRANSNGSADSRAGKSSGSTPPEGCPCGISGLRYRQKADFGCWHLHSSICLHATAPLELSRNRVKNHGSKVMKNRIKCNGCGSNLNATGMQPRSTASCPKCGNTVAVPFPGIGAGKFAGLYLGSWIVYVLLVGMMGGLEHCVFPMLPLWFGFKLWLGYQRAINIGWKPWTCILVLIPFIGAIVMACYKTGEGAKKVRGSQSQVPTFQPTNPPEFPPDKPLQVPLGWKPAQRCHHSKLVERTAVTIDDQSETLLPGGSSVTVAARSYDSPPLKIPTPEEVEARSGVVLSEKEKRVVRAVMRGESIEAAATEAETTTTAAMAIYGEFYSAFCKMAEHERRAYLNIAIGAAEAAYQQQGMNCDANVQIEHKANFVETEFSPEIDADEDALKLDASNHMKNGEWNLLCKVSEVLVGKWPYERQHWIWLAHAVRLTHSLEEAEKVLLDALSFLPDDEIIRFTLACYAAQIGDLRTARARLDRAIAINPAVREWALDEPDLKPLPTTQGHGHAPV